LCARKKRRREKEGAKEKNAQKRGKSLCAKAAFHNLTISRFRVKIHAQKSDIGSFFKKGSEVLNEY
jgi:hypothetical protein